MANKFYCCFLKRVMDIVLGSAGLLVACVPMVLIALIIKFLAPFNGGGSVIFRQTRVGRYGVPFVIYKFRSMRADTPDNITTSDFADASMYITPVGKFLRRTSLDELPQLLNVLRGDMSLVGPRPLIADDKRRVAMQRELGIDTLRPGLTGWAQVSGRDAISDEEKVRMDAYYMVKISPWLDMECMVRTVCVVLNCRGNVEGSELALRGAVALEKREVV